MPAIAELKIYMILHSSACTVKSVKKKVTPGTDECDRPHASRVVSCGYFDVHLRLVEWCDAKSAESGRPVPPTVYLLSRSSLP